MKTVIDRTHISIGSRDTLYLSDMNKWVRHAKKMHTKLDIFYCMENKWDNRRSLFAKLERPLTLEETEYKKLHDEWCKKRSERNSLQGKIGNLTSRMKEYTKLLDSTDDPYIQEAIENSPQYVEMLEEQLGYREALAALPPLPKEPSSVHPRAVTQRVWHWIQHLKDPNEFPFTFVLEP